MHDSFSLLYILPCTFALFFSPTLPLSLLKIHHGVGEIPLAGAAQDYAHGPHGARFGGATRASRLCVFAAGTEVLAAEVRDGRPARGAAAPDGADGGAH